MYIYFSVISVQGISGLTVTVVLLWLPPGAGGEGGLQKLHGCQKCANFDLNGDYINVCNYSSHNLFMFCACFYILLQFKTQQKPFQSCKVLQKEFPSTMVSLLLAKDSHGLIASGCTCVVTARPQDTCQCPAELGGFRSLREVYQALSR